MSNKMGSLIMRSVHIKAILCIFRPVCALPYRIGIVYVQPEGHNPQRYREIGFETVAHIAPSKIVPDDFFLLNYFSEKIRLGIRPFTMICQGLISLKDIYFKMSSCSCDWCFNNSFTVTGDNNRL